MLDTTAEYKVIGTRPLRPDGANKVTGPGDLRRRYLDTMQDGAPILHQDLTLMEMGQKTDPVSNIAKAAFASETVVDELAEQLGFDSREMRCMNGAKEGDRRVDGPAFPRLGYLETVRAALEPEHYATSLTGLKRGRGEEFVYHRQR
ncbi:hypothetical protein NKDENANG_00144 [Candidatus Entotheonellaceae bacterium PAL068K]